MTALIDSFTSNTKEFHFMFEFNGWAVLRYHTHDTDSMKQEKQLYKLIHYISEIDTEEVVTFKSRNGLDSLLMSGLHNHRKNYVVGIFEKIAEIMPGSYGLLYIHDDEDQSKNQDNTNHFVVWKLVRGKLTEQQDHYLSPYIPTVEDPFDETRND